MYVHVYNILCHVYHEKFSKGFHITNYMYIITTPTNYPLTTPSHHSPAHLMEGVYTLFSDPVPQFNSLVIATRQYQSPVW